MSREPKTLGERLRKRRFELALHQSQAAQRLAVSARTLSLWETDTVYPTWAYQPGLVEYLGCDPFTNPAHGGPKGNETEFVAISAPTSPLTLGQQIRKRRLELRKNRKECAEEMGVSVKSLWGWETSRCQPCASHFERLVEFLGFDPALINPIGGSH